MKKIFILAAVILCISCNNDVESKQATLISANINVYLKNSAGENILNTDKYPENNISIKYLIAGKELGYGYDTPSAILDNPKGFFLGILSENETGKGMRVFLNSDASEEYPITYIHWNSIETDIIKTKYKRGNGNDGPYVILEKVWLNDVLVWEVEKQGQTNNNITIVK
ncbi:hypothetical protein AB3G34_09725 [Flavobacterium sp. WC2409]|uniref:Uncharacterized protein n=1 Tax=Flavobacterium sp. WC2409 TaxID=3234139 RepID=A0AB39VZ99_9FLAO